jgi:protein CpxP
MKLDKVKILSILVVLLICINLATLAGVWMMRPPNPHGFGAMSPKEFIITKLEFTDEQAEAFELLRKSHFDTIQKLREQIRSEKEEMYAGLKTKGNEAAAYDHLAKVIACEEQAEKITFEHFRQVRELCNDQQKQHFDAIINQVIKMVGLQAPPPPHELRQPGGPPLP